jgi:hypothetical protein
MSHAVHVSVASPNYSYALCSTYFKDKPSLQEHTKMHLIEDAKAKFKPATREKKEKKFVCKEVTFSFTLVCITFIGENFLRLIVTI